MVLSAEGGRCDGNAAEGEAQRALALADEKAALLQAARLALVDRIAESLRRLPPEQLLHTFTVREKEDLT